MLHETLEQIVAQIKKNSTDAAAKVKAAVNIIAETAAPIWITGDAKKLFEELNVILEQTGPTMENATSDTITILNQAYKSMLEAGNSAQYYEPVANADTKLDLTITDLSVIKDFDGGILGSTDDLKGLIELVVSKEQEIEEVIKGYASSIQGLAQEFFAKIGTNNGNMEGAIEDLYTRLLDAFAKLFHILNSEDNSLTKAIQGCIDKYDDAQQLIANSVKNVSVN